jgi:hypothetical protein
MRSSGRNKGSCRIAPWRPPGSWQRRLPVSRHAPSGAGDCHSGISR